MSKSNSRRSSKRKRTRGNQETLSNAQLNSSAIRVSVQNTPRNPFANHPLMKKGGAHQKSKSAERAKARRETNRLARDWSAQITTLLKSYFSKLSLIY